MRSDPVIIIPGIGQSKLILADENGNKIKNAWPVELDQSAIVNELKSSLMKMVLFRKDGGFSDRVAAIAESACEPLAVNEDGTKKHNVIPVSYEKSLAECNDDEKKYIYKMIPMEQLGAKIGEDRLFFFAYDPFGDAYDTASRLDGFIGFVKNKTGSEKVSLVSVSQGGVVLRVYLDLYGGKGEIGKVVNFVSALDGSSLIADIFDDKLLLDDPASLLGTIGGKAASLASAVGMLPKDVIANTIEKSLSVLKKSLIFNCTMMWGSIPAGRFGAILNKYPSMNESLKAKVTRLYDFTVYFPERAKALAENGMKFYQICGCGMGIVPVCESKNIQSDGIVDVSSASFGAVCTSDESDVDVSGCVFPENTWFFNNMSHADAAFNDVALSLACDILSDEVSGVCDKYPQFNGSRNIRKLKYELVPKAEKAISEGKNCAELEKALADYEKILSNTVINDDSDVKELEGRLKALLDSES